jgi:type IV pilus assembly protein PilV
MFKVKLKMKTLNIKLVKSQTGSVLLEAMIAILIFSFGILAISGLQGVMIKNTTDAQFRSEASYIAQQQIGKMWANPANLGSFVNQTTILTNLPNGKLKVTSFLNSRVKIEVSWQAPGQDAHKYVTTASIDAN